MRNRQTKIEDEEHKTHEGEQLKLKDEQEN